MTMSLPENDAEDSDQTTASKASSADSRGNASQTTGSSKAVPKSSSDGAAGINMLLLRRLRMLTPLLFPGLTCLTTVLFLLLLLVCFLEQFVVYHVGLISSNYYLVLGQMDWPGFVSTTIYSLALVSAIAGVLSGKTYISSVLYVSWRQVLTRALHRIYFSGINYYSISISPIISLDNPDQRMTQDVDLLCRTLGTMVATIIVSPFKIAYYTYQTYITTGWLGPTMILLFFLLSSIVNRFAMDPIVPCVVAVEKCEGDLRFKHMQIRAASESVAFHVSGAVEATKTNTALDELVKAKQRLFNKQFWLNLCQNMFDYFGSILSYLPMAVPIFTGVYDDLDPSTLASIISKNGFVCIMLISSLSGLVDLCSSVVQMAGVTHRIAQLLEALRSLNTDWDSTNDKASASYSDLKNGRRSSSSGGPPPSSRPPPYSPLHSSTPLLDTAAAPPPPYSADTHDAQQNQATAAADNLLVLADNISTGPLPASTTATVGEHPCYTVVSPSSTHAHQECSDGTEPLSSASAPNTDNTVAVSSQSASVTDLLSGDLDAANVTNEETATGNTAPPSLPYVPEFTGSAFPVGFMLQNVTLTVPGSNKTLVKDLNLNITRGHNLLIMGPSSCGKTSLLRALRGLWPIQEGVLAYQSYCGPKAVMFLPQKPFLTNGTLREQIVYPEHLCEDNSYDNCDVVVHGGDRYAGSGSTSARRRSVCSTNSSTNEGQADIGNAREQYNSSEGTVPNTLVAGNEHNTNGHVDDNITTPQSTTDRRGKREGNREHVASTGGTGSSSNVVDARIVDLLSQMNMSSLLQRCGGLDHDPGWVWSDVLSPGEVQRLCFLRVLHHRPHFAILDEATSALSTDVEAVLYRLARAAGTTVISVGHRTSLRPFHDTLLLLRSDGGWTMQQLTPS